MIYLQLTLAIKNRVSSGLLLGRGGPQQNPASEEFPQLAWVFEVELHCCGRLLATVWESQGPGVGTGSISGDGAESED